jgi:hypothetical protein
LHTVTSIKRLGYGLDIQGVRHQFPVRERDFSLLHYIQTSSQAHPASHKITMGTSGLFPAGEAAHSPPNAKVQNMSSWHGVQ